MGIIPFDVLALAKLVVFPVGIRFAMKRSTSEWRNKKLERVTLLHTSPDINTHLLWSHIHVDKASVLPCRWRSKLEESDGCDCKHSGLFTSARQVGIAARKHPFLHFRLLTAPPTREQVEREGTRGQ